MLIVPTAKNALFSGAEEVSGGAALCLRLHLFHRAANGRSGLHEIDAPAGRTLRARRA